MQEIYGGKKHIHLIQSVRRKSKIMANYRNIIILIAMKQLLTGKLMQKCRKKSGAENQVSLTAFVLPEKLNAVFAEEIIQEKRISAKARHIFNGFAGQRKK